MLFDFLSFPLCPLHCIPQACKPLQRLLLKKQCFRQSRQDIRKRDDFSCPSGYSSVLCLQCIALKPIKWSSLGLHPEKKLEEKSQQEGKVFWEREDETDGTKEKKANGEGEAC